ncbi:MAG TPA: orotidine-5'-phosphate decarboxylase [Acidobacteriaceae bacterium]|jgi:orotidine-5'-phosphate decarboxylase|nr:orotidine-5'-phosphate decarboxylase [Acidobacteriaceae bacterium]
METPESSQNSASKPRSAPLLTPLSTASGLKKADSRPASDALIIALDTASADAALALADRLRGTCRWMKVGLELYLAAGNPVIADLRARGFSIFLDLKLHDIPNTVAGAVRSAAKAGASLLTVHAAGGPAMLRAAAEAAASVENPPRLLAVTVLTSMDAAELAAIGIEQSPAEQVLRLGRMARSNGVDGLVCSPEEVGMLRLELGNDALLVTPGIRPAGSAADDQKRMATPGAAIAAGASYLVVGRPITQAEDPVRAAQRIVEEIEGALRG